MSSRFVQDGAGAIVAAAMLAGCASTARIPSPSTGLSLSAQIYRPDGGGRYPAVILLGPCGGVTPHMGDWARWLNSQGYVALVVDSLAPRGVSTACEGGRGPNEFQVGRDAVDALVFARTLPFVDGDRLAVMGWSLGASAALEASSSRRTSWPGYADTAPFQGVVAFYPSCYSLDRQTPTPTLLLLAARDDWTPPGPCLDVVGSDPRLAGRVRLELYPDALHAFDRPDAKPYLGHAMSYDGGAAGAAHEAVKAFLAERLAAQRP